MSTILETENSALILHDLEPEICNLIEQCVQVVDPELDVNPEIMIYGKVCYQHRSVGFYKRWTEQPHLYKINSHIRTDSQLRKIRTLTSNKY